MRFAQGAPSNDPNLGGVNDPNLGGVNDPNLGVIVHQFDGQEDQGDDGRGDRRWLPCPATLWCGAFRECFACSIINARLSGMDIDTGKEGYCCPPSGLVTLLAGRQVCGAGYPKEETKF